MASTDSGVSSNPLTYILDEGYPPPDYPGDDIKDSSYGSRGYLGVEKANKNGRLQERQKSDLSKATSGYIDINRANNNRELQIRLNKNGPLYDNNLLPDLDNHKCVSISTKRQMPAIFNVSKSSTCFK
ncbi:uncharacterized protein LOC134271398 [Saccostrea cucullata]|uniref:uncharacterized protein LOC134271398 n=1 Tax=Saccostrea cuccullata TaxID=36930 RepID=UPI002ED1FF45